MCVSCGRKAPLCEVCVNQQTLWTASEASRIGNAWARSVREVMPGQLWPAYDQSEKVRTLARKKVAKLSMGDERLLDALARICAKAAAYHYENLTPEPGTVSFMVGDPRRR